MFIIAIITPLICILGIFMVLLLPALLDSHMQKKKEEKNLLYREEKSRLYREKSGIPENANLISCICDEGNQTDLDGSWDTFIWKESTNLFLCRTDEEKYNGKVKIPIENVQFYTRNGDYSVISNIEGGGVDVGGAIIGGVVAGGVGALLAGRERITTTNKEIDDRNTYLYYVESNQNKRMVFTSQGYKVLLKLIPEKEIGYIENKKIVEASKPKEDNNNVYKDIEKLAELKEKGILTEDEFNQKKRLLLDKIQ
ncbi:SHOCT domain-containing protein [Clostridium chromiireducens]|uniref:SHOCT domain-containing protein n=1 Tax=Clostridium chromiireducens TaxID=225345 RepID=UPI003AF42C3A